MAASIPRPGRAVPAAAALLSLAFLGLWSALPDKVYVFDGVMFSGVVERGVDEWRRELYNPRHLLFNPAFLVLRDALSACGVSVGAYRLFQAVNALAGVAGLWLFGLLLREAGEDDAVALAGAALLGASWSYGTRATEGQVYMILAVGGLWTLWAAARLLRRPSAASALHVALALSMSVLFHAAAVVLVPAVLAALWLGLAGGRAAALPALAAGAALVAIPYRLAFGSAGLRGFMSSATDYRATAESYWSGLVLKFWNNGGLGPGERLLLSWRETGWGLAVLPASAAAALGPALWLAVGGGLIVAWRTMDARRRALAVVLLLAWSAFAVLNAFWLGGLFFAPVPLAALLALLACAGAGLFPRMAPRARRGLLGTLGAAALALGLWNVRSGLLPQSRVENNLGYRQALFIRDHTVASSWVMISGLGIGNAKVYLPMFASRSREVLEYYFDRNPKERALALLSAFVARQTENGVPLYLLSDVVEDAGVQESMRRAWGVTMPELQAAFGPGKLVLMARGPGVSVYLYVPGSRQPELFTVLGYSVLTESDPARLGESVTALKEIASEMTPAERRRAARLMRSSRWGFELLWKGFSPYMSPESREAARERAGRFAEFQKTADFWLRAGNLYKFLGLKADAIDAWGRAHALSRNPAILRDIEALKRAK